MRRYAGRRSRSHWAQAIQERQRVRAAALQYLIDDSMVRSKHIHVRVSHGTMTLTGYVRTESERRAAVEDVTRLAGGLEVRDQIEVR